MDKESRKELEYETTKEEKDEDEETRVGMVEEGPSRKGGVILLVAVAMVIILLAVQCTKGGVGEIEPRVKVDMTEDANSEKGGHAQTDAEEIQEDVNKKVADGLINISMNTNPVYETGKSEGNLLIVNETMNKYPQIVEIYRDDTEEMIYKSGLIKVGSRVESARLNKEMPKGVYSCTAYFSSINEETQEVQGKAGAKIEITVNK